VGGPQRPRQPPRPPQQVPQAQSEEHEQRHRSLEQEAVPGRPHDEVRPQADRGIDPAHAQGDRRGKEQGQSGPPAQPPPAGGHHQGRRRPEEAPVEEAHHLGARVPGEPRETRHDPRPEEGPGRRLLEALEALGNAGPPGEQQDQGQRDRQGREGERPPALAPEPAAPLAPLSRHERVEGRQPQRHGSEDLALGLGEHGGGEQHPRRQAPGRPRAGRKQQQQAAAEEARQRQVAVRGRRAARHREGGEGEQRGGEGRPRRRGTARQRLGPAVDQQQPGGEKNAVERPEGVMVQIRPGRLQHGHLGHRHQQRIPGVGDVPPPLSQRGRMDRPLAAHPARLGAPGHAPVPVRQRIVQGVAEQGQGDQDAGRQREPLHEPLRPLSPG
jgi:hypothetical protein